MANQTQTLTELSTLVANDVASKLKLNSSSSLNESILKELKTISLLLGNAINKTPGSLDRQYKLPDAFKNVVEKKEDKKLGSSAISSVKEKAPLIIETILKRTEETIEKAKKLGSSAISSVKEKAKKLGSNTISSVKEKAPIVIQELLKRTEETIEKAKKLGSSAMSSVKEKAPIVIQELLKKAEETIEKGKKLGSNTISSVKEKAKKLGSGAISSVKEKAPSIIETILKKAEETIEKAKKLGSNTISSVKEKSATNDTKQEGIFGLLFSKITSFIDNKTKSQQQTQATSKSLLEDKTQETQRVEIANFKELTEILPNAFKTALTDSFEYFEYLKPSLKKITELLESIEKKDFGGDCGGGLLDVLPGRKGKRAKGRNTRARNKKATQLKKQRAAYKAGQGPKPTLAKPTQAKPSLISKIKTPKIIGDTASKVGKGLSKAAPILGKVGGVATGALFAGMEFADRKSEGQSTTQAAVGTGAGVAGAAAGAIAGQLLIPIPVVGAVIGGMVGGWLASNLADKTTGANDPVTRWKNRTESTADGKKLIEAFSKLPNDKQKKFGEMLAPTLTNPEVIASTDEIIRTELNKIVAFEEKEKKAKIVEKTPSITPESIKQAVVTETSKSKDITPRIVPESIKQEAVKVSHSKEISDSSLTSNLGPRDEFLKKQHEALSKMAGSNPTRNIDSITAPEQKSITAELVDSSRDFSNKSVQPNQASETSKIKSETEISSEKPPHNPSTAISSESMPQRKPLQQNEGISSSKTTNATAKIEPEKASQSTVGEKLIKGIFGNSDKFLDKIAKNSDTTNQNLTLLVHGFNGLSKALEKFGVTVSQNSNEGGNTTVINSQTGKQRTVRSAEIAKSGNREIASFRMEMEKLRGQPA